MTSGAEFFLQTPWLPGSWRSVALDMDGRRPKTNRPIRALPAGYPAAAAQLVPIFVMTPSLPENKTFTVVRNY